MSDDSNSPGSLGEIQELLKRHVALGEDSNKILHDMRKWGRVAFAAKVVIWTIVLIVPLLLIPYLAPLIPGLNGTGSSTSLTSGSLFGYPSPTEIQAIFHPSK